MSITCEWFDKDATIIIIRFNQRWTLEEFRDVGTKLEEYSHQVVGRHDIIADFTKEVLMMPAGSLELWLTLVEQRDTEFPNWGLTVWVVGNSIMEAYFDTGNELSETVRKHTRRATTIEEAVSLIIEHRKTQIR